MARKTALLKFSVRTRAELEEPVCELIEKIFGISPIVEIKPGSARISISTYLDFSPKPAALKTIASEVRTLDRHSRVITRRIKREDWAESWKRHFPPLDIGPLLIKPSWSKRRPRAGQQMVILDPGLSFGTGQHPTTKFCLEQLVRLSDGRKSMLDLGTGSGILAIAAARSGYSPILAIDNDPDAIRIARSNAKSNKVSRRIKFAVADLGDAAFDGQKFDLICANLTADVLISCSRKIVSALAEGGSLVLAGILKTQFDSVVAMYESLGLKATRVRGNGIWKSVSLR